MLLISGVVVQGWWCRYRHGIPLFYECYSVWAMFDRLVPPHRPSHYLQLHPRHAQLLPCILEPRAWTMVVISDVVIVVQGWWYIDGYDIQPFYVWRYMRHGQRLTGVDQPIYHGMTSNYTHDILSSNPVYWKNQELEPWDLISGVVVQWWWCIYWYGIPLFYECYMKHEQYLTGLYHPIDH